jgi:hypothetical protein
VGRSGEWALGDHVQRRADERPGAQRLAHAACSGLRPLQSGPPPAPRRRSPARCSRSPSARPRRGRQAARARWAPPLRAWRRAGWVLCRCERRGLEHGGEGSPCVRGGRGSRVRGGGPIPSSHSLAQAYLLRTERELWGLLDGGWALPRGAGLAYRRAWLRGVRLAQTPSQLAPRLLELEAALRRWAAQAALAGGPRPRRRDLPPRRCARLARCQPACGRLCVRLRGSRPRPAVPPRSSLPVFVAGWDPYQRDPAELYALERAALDRANNKDSYQRRKIMSLKWQAAGGRRGGRGGRPRKGGGGQGGEGAAEYGGGRGSVAALGPRPAVCRTGRW